MAWLGPRPWAGLVGRGSVVTPTARTTLRTALGKGLCKGKKFKKSEITMEVGGWGGSRSRSEFFVCSENRPKNALNQ